MELHAVSLRVGLGGRPILRGTNLTACPGEVLGLIGPNGAGQSTLLRTTACRIAPTSGSILIGDEELRRLPHRLQARVMSFLPQDTTLAVNFRVRDPVALGRYAHRSRWSAPSSTDARVVEQALLHGGLLHRIRRAEGDDGDHHSAGRTAGGSRRRPCVWSPRWRRTWPRPRRMRLDE